MDIYKILGIKLNKKASQVYSHLECGLDCCIYNRNFHCALKKIKVNSFGGCDYCILTSIPPIIVKNRNKEEHLTDNEKNS